jgi:hypothetical protein
MVAEEDSKVKKRTYKKKDAGMARLGGHAGACWFR